MIDNTVFDCQILRLPKNHKYAGNLTAVNNMADIPFRIQRIYYLYDIPSGAERGGHAHRELVQLIVAASGSYSVVLKDGKNQKVVSLNRPDYGLLIVPGVWRDLIEFSSGAICLVLASEKYDETDYFRDFEEYQRLKTGARPAGNAEIRIEQ